MDKEQMEKVFAFVTRITGVKKKDLVSTTEEAEYNDLSELLSAIEPTIKTHNEEKMEQLEGKNIRQAHRKTEKLLKDSLAGFQFTSNKQTEMFAELGEHLETLGQQKEDKPFTISQALQLKEVQDYIQTEKENYKNEHISSFKVKQQVRELAIVKLKELNANLSTDPKRNKRQIDLIENEIYKNYNVVFEGDNPVIQDKEGERLFNKDNNSFLGFEDVLKIVSPVDFSDGTTQLNTAPDPLRGTGVNNNTFGFTESELSKLTSKEFYAAEQEGNPEKADFILNEMQSRKNRDA